MIEPEKVAIDPLRAEQELDRAKEKADEKISEPIDVAQEGMSLRDRCKKTNYSYSMFLLVISGN